MKTTLKKIRKASERGQAIILIAIALVGIVAIVGLMVDGGILLIEYARLKRGIDAASIAAASQFRKGFVGVDLEKAGLEFLNLNGVNISSENVSIFTCDYPDTSHDETLCADFTGGVARKLVRIIARRYVDFGFMRVVGMNGTWIEAASVGEAASIDMVLAMDTSSSMAYETTVGGDPNRSDPAVLGTHAGDDPIACNNDPSRRCEPMGTIKDVAIDFVDELFFPYDRISVVAFTEQQSGGSATRNPYLILPFSDEQSTVEAAIRALRVFEPFICPTDGSTPLGPCLFFDPATSPPRYIGQPCFPYQVGTKDADGNLIEDAGGNPILDPTSCGASNVGGGLFMAGDQFAAARQDSFWAVVALIGGPANAAIPPSNPLGVCPQNTWDLPGGSGFCRDLDPMPASYNPPAVADWSNSVQVTAFNNYANSYNWAAYDVANATRHPSTDSNYDADDFARDGADHITSPDTGQGASLYTICLGTYCRAYPNSNDPASAELLGRYMSLHAGGPTANHGLYFQTNNAAELAQIFQSIANNIFTRISK